MEKVFFGILGVIFFALLMSLPAAAIVWLLWNWVMVDVFALSVLTFWQAWGLYMLCSILLKSTTYSSS